MDAPLTIPNGQCLAAVNYELLTTDGYRRVSGYERYDGQDSPTDASYWILNYDIGSVAFNVGDIVTGATSGATGKVLLDVPGATNLLTYSEQFDHADWFKSGLTVTANTEIAPDGLITADKIIEDSSTGQHYIYQIYALIIGTTYTYSVRVKPLERTEISLRTGAAGGYRVTFTLVDNGSAVVNVGSGDGFSISKDGDYYNCSITFTEGVGADRGHQIYLVENGNVTYTGDGVSGLYVWGAQLVEGSVPGDYTRTIAGNTRGGHLVLSNVSGSFIDTELLSFIGAGDGFNSGFSAGFG